MAVAACAIFRIFHESVFCLCSRGFFALSSLPRRNARAQKHKQINDNILFGHVFALLSSFYYHYCCYDCLPIRKSTVVETVACRRANGKVEKWENGKKRRDKDVCLSLRRDVCKRSKSRQCHWIVGLLCRSE